MHSDRKLTAADRAIAAVGQLLSTVAAPAVAARPFPGRAKDENLSESERLRAGRYMRVNHTGEICAQSLYAAQGLTARDPAIAQQMQQAAREETDHLVWCERRLNELGARKSLLNPLWGIGAFAMGGIAGLAGAKWNLGFVAETERQVERHLDSHMNKLPSADKRSREVVAQMREDEIQHGAAARAAGGAELPRPVRAMMKLSARAMTSVSHWI